MLWAHAFDVPASCEEAADLYVVATNLKTKIDLLSHDRCIDVLQSFPLIFKWPCAGRCWCMRARAVWAWQR